MPAKQLTKEQIELLAKKSGSSEKEIVEMYEDFIKEFPSGHADRAGLSKMFKTLFPGAKVDKFATFIFQAFDENNDGKLSFDEFVAGVMLFARSDDENLTPEEKGRIMDIFFKLFDVNHDGQISNKELRRVFESLGPLIGEEVKFSKEEINLLIETIDKDGSKTLNKAEFVEFFKDFF